MRQQIHGDSALMNGTEVFMGELSQAIYTSVCKAHQTARYIISISQTVRIKFLSFISYPACGILIQQHHKTKFLTCVQLLRNSSVTFPSQNMPKKVTLPKWSGKQEVLVAIREHHGRAEKQGDLSFFPGLQAAFPRSQLWPPLHWCHFSA